MPTQTKKFAGELLACQGRMFILDKNMETVIREWLLGHVGCRRVTVHLLPRKLTIQVEGQEQ